jgi:outer membrane protein TolC
MRKIILGFLGLIAVTGFIYAEESLTLTEELAVELGMTQNLSLRSSSLDYQNSEEEKNNRWNNFLPSFSANAGVSRKDEFLSTETMQTSGDPWSMSFSGGISLPLGLTNFYSMEASSLGFEAQSIQFENSQKSLESSIRKQFNYLLASEENVLLRQKSIDLAQKRYEQAEVNFQNGLVSELNVLQAQNSVELLKPAYQDVKTAYENQLMAFQNLLGMDLSQRIELQGNLEVKQIELEAQVLVDSFLAGRLDVQSSQKNREIMENQEKLLKAGYMAPSLSLSASWDNGITSLSESPSWSDSATVSAYLSIPIDGFIPGSSDRTSINITGRNVEKSSIQVENTMNNAEQEIRSLLMTLEGAWTNIETSELSVELAQKTYEMTEAAYSQGTSELLDVEDAQNKLLSAHQDLLLSKYSYQAGILDLELALNTDIKLVMEITKE